MDTGAIKNPKQCLKDMKRSEKKKRKNIFIAQNKFLKNNKSNSI